MKSPRVASSSSLPEGAPYVHPAPEDNMNGDEEFNDATLSNGNASSSTNRTAVGGIHESYSTQDCNDAQGTTQSSANHDTPKRTFKSLRSRFRSSSASSLQSLSSNTSTGAGSINSSTTTSNAKHDEKKNSWKLLKSSRFRYKRKKKKELNVTTDTLPSISSQDNDQQQTNIMQNDDDSECDSISLVSADSSQRSIDSSSMATNQSYDSPKSGDLQFLYGNESMEPEKIDTSHRVSVPSHYTNPYTGPNTTSATLDEKENHGSLTIADLDSNGLIVDDPGLDIFDKDGITTIPTSALHEQTPIHEMLSSSQPTVMDTNKSDTTAMANDNNASNTVVNASNNNNMEGSTFHQNIKSDESLTSSDTGADSKDMVTSVLQSDNDAFSSREVVDKSDQHNVKDALGSGEKESLHDVHQSTTASPPKAITKVDGDDFFTATELDGREQEKEHHTAESMDQERFQYNKGKDAQYTESLCITPPRRSAAEKSLGASVKDNVVSPRRLQSALKPSILRNLSADLPSTPIRSEKSVSFADEEDGGKIVSSEHHIAVSPNSLTRRVRRHNSLTKMKKATKEKNNTNGNRSSSSSSSKTRILVLLMHPESKQYELISLYFTPSEETKLYTLLNLIPKTASYKPLQTQKYTGFCRPRNGHEMINGLSVINYAIEQDEVLIAIPKNYKGMECSKLSKPILEDDRLVRLIKKLRKKQRKKKKKKDEIDTSKTTSTNSATTTTTTTNTKSRPSQDILKSVFTLIIIPLIATIVYLKFQKGHF